MDAMPRLLLVRETALDGSHHVVTLVNFLVQEGFRVTAACAEAGSAPVEGLSPNAELVKLRPRGRGRLSAIAVRMQSAVRLRTLLRSRPTNILYVVDSWTLPTLWLATRGRFRWRRARLVYHTYDWLDPTLHAGRNVKLERKMCHRSDLVVNTDRSRARLQQALYGLIRTPLHIPNFLPRATPQPVRDPAARRELLGGREVPEACLMVYPTAVWNEDSAQRLTFELIAAVARLPERYRLATFYREGVEHERCRGFVDSSGLQRRITFLPVVPLERLLHLLGSADLGAILYDDRASSGYFMASPDKLSLLAACGVPYVASDFPNLEAVTYKLGLGVCCDARDPLTLARAIRELGEGPVPLVERKAHVRAMFERELYFERHAARLVGALHQLTESPRA
jgi:glycosyltransferase involved in cell wall biosynthesis